MGFLTVLKIVMMATTRMGTDVRPLVTLSAEMDEGMGVKSVMMDLAIPSSPIRVAHRAIHTVVA